MKSIIPFSIFISLAGCTMPGKDVSQDLVSSPVNLSHALSLVDSMQVEGETISYIRIYADAPGYEPVAATGEGIACVDDAGRFMEVLETEILTYHSSELLPLARGLTQFLLYMSREDGLWYNFIYTDGSINTTHQNSQADFGWWAVRGLRGLAAAYLIFVDRPEYVELMVEVRARIIAADVYIQEAVSHYPEQELTSLGMKPAWLIKSAPDMNSELLIALTKLHSSGDFDYLETIEKIAEGIIGYQFFSPDHDLDGMYLCWKNIWHNWGNNQAFSLLKAFTITSDSTLLKSVIDWGDSFVPYVIENDFPWEITLSFSGEYSLKEVPQIAYGIHSLYRGVKLLAEMTGDSVYAERSEKVFQWFAGENIAAVQMYQPESGRCYDGIDNSNSVNINSGAESTIECLSAIQKRGYF
ncbi:MAG: hypothetical protein ACE5EE_06110 [Fidelibacterota bacterium]